MSFPGNIITPGTALLVLQEVAQGHWGGVCVRFPDSWLASGGQEPTKAGNPLPYLGTENPKKICQVLLWSVSSSAHLSLSPCHIFYKRPRLLGNDAHPPPLIDYLTEVLYDFGWLLSCLFLTHLKRCTASPCHIITITAALIAFRLSRMALIRVTFFMHCFSPFHRKKGKSISFLSR